MVKLITVAIVAATLWMTAADEKQPAKPNSFYDFTVKDIDGKDVTLSKYRGNVCLVVNVASKWGLTNPSYSGLESLFKKYKDKGLRVLAFPANNFGNQEPDPNEKIKKFCATKGATFDVFAKVSVKGDDQCPLYKYLTTYPDEEIAGDVKWNFQKYLVGKDGKVLAMFGPRTLPDSEEVTAAVEKALSSDG